MLYYRISRFRFPSLRHLGLAFPTVPLRFLARHLCKTGTSNVKLGALVSIVKAGGDEKAYPFQSTISFVVAGDHLYAQTSL